MDAGAKTNYIKDPEGRERKAYEGRADQGEVRTEDLCHAAKSADRRVP
jgi:hypothetical protein